MPTAKEQLLVVTVHAVMSPQLTSFIQSRNVVTLPVSDTAVRTPVHRAVVQYLQNSDSVH
jgi:molybdopterin biosynthesis enzyme MoaB